VDLQFVQVDSKDQVDEVIVFLDPRWKLLFPCSLLLGLAATHFGLESAIGAALYTRITRGFLFAYCVLGFFHFLIPLALGFFQFFIPLAFRRWQIALFHCILFAGTSFFLWLTSGAPSNELMFNHFMKRAIFAQGVFALAIYWSYRLVPLMRRGRPTEKSGPGRLQEKLKHQKLPQLETIHPHKDGLRMRLFFPSSESEKIGLVDLHFVEKRNRLDLHCRLPVRSTPAEEIILQPQSEGLKGEVQSIGKRKLNHDTLDALYVIRSEREELDLLLLLQGPLLGLAPFSAKIEIRGEEVGIHLPEFEEEGVDWSILLDEISALWQNVERYNQGWRPEKAELLAIATHQVSPATQKNPALKNHLFYRSPYRMWSHLVFMVLWVFTMLLSWSAKDLSLIKLGLKDANGKKAGLWIEWYPSGQKKEEGSYKNGNEEGNSTKWHRNGQKEYEGSYKNGKKEGKWIEWRRDGKKDEVGSYKNGKKEGKWSYWGWGGQKEYEGSYKNDVKEGNWTTWHDNGQKEHEGSYKNGKKEGKWTEWWYYGQWSEGNYKNDVKEGNWTTWHDNGQKKHEGSYKNGKKDGKWIEWDKYGGPKKVWTYENGIARDQIYLLE
jgi:antitoxin component YwqK of YwqJK toxin-antitoxin module